MSTVGERLKSIRESRGYTQGQVADALGVSSKTISTWENNTRTPKRKTLLGLSDFYKISPEWILGSDELINSHTDDSTNIWPIMAMKNRSIRFKYIDQSPAIEINGDSGDFVYMYKQLDSDEKAFILKCMRAEIDKTTM